MCDGELEYESGADCALVCPEHGERAIKHVCEEWLKELAAERDQLLVLTDQQAKTITTLLRQSDMMETRGED